MQDFGRTVARKICTSSLYYFQINDLISGTSWIYLQTEVETIMRF